MMYFTHVAFAGLCYTLASKTGVVSNEGIGLAAALVGGLLPDIDTPRSWIGSRLKIISIPLGKIIGHRGFSHSALATGLMIFLMAYGAGANVPIVGGLAIGYLSHLLGDYLTPQGIPFFWPKKDHYSVALFSTGSVVERTVFATFVVLLLWAYNILPLHVMAGLG